jgi:hypothetical protein
LFALQNQILMCEHQIHAFLGPKLDSAGAAKKIASRPNRRLLRRAAVFGKSHGDQRKRRRPRTSGSQSPD